MGFVAKIKKYVEKKKEGYEKYKTNRLSERAVRAEKESAVYSERMKHLSKIRSAERQRAKYEKMNRSSSPSFMTGFSGGSSGFGGGIASNPSFGLGNIGGGKSFGGKPSYFGGESVLGGGSLFGSSERRSSHKRRKHHVKKSRRKKGKSGKTITIRLG
jgi:hypothetical protein